MSKELEQAVKRIEQKIDNKIDQLVIMARESITPSLTPLLNDIHKNIDAIKTEFRSHTDVHEKDIKNLNEKIDESNKKLDPLVEANDRKVWLFNLFMKIGAAFLLIVGIVKGYNELK